MENSILNLAGLREAYKVGQIKGVYVNFTLNP